MEPIFVDFKPIIPVKQALLKNWNSVDRIPVLPPKQELVVETGIMDSGGVKLFKKPQTVQPYLFNTN